ncbi:unnamed protein product [Ambrosiozyma monospora]|uniref:DNA ligase (ATP) n=1 Tax=Ambrosiozyma monospora TaxID=43982 RepID=A0A9W6YX35_AMBMO|nr:unnamed protein product [Ambrosiozyma monospora]
MHFCGKNMNGIMSHLANSQEKLFHEKNLMKSVSDEAYSDDDYEDGDESESDREELQKDDTAASQIIRKECFLSEDILSTASKPLNHGKFPLFSELVSSLFRASERRYIETYRRKETLTQFCARYYKDFITYYRETVGDDILIVAKLAVSSYDKLRLFSIQEKKLCSMVCKQLGFKKGSEKYIKIHQYKSKAFNTRDYFYKLADTLAVYVEDGKRQLEDPKPMNIEEVNAVLDKLAEINSPKEQQQIIFKTTERMSFEEIKYFFIIILKKDIVKFKLFMDAWHPEAYQFFISRNSLQEVLWSLYSPNIHLDNSQKDIKVMFPFIPQRSKRPVDDYERIAQRFNKEFLDGDVGSAPRKYNKGFILEQKFDGERTQVHIERKPNGKGFMFKYYSRKSYDFTPFYGSDSEISGGCMSHFITDANIGKNVMKCILDGEMICYDPISKESLPFSTVRTAAANAISTLKDYGSIADDQPRPMFVAFDCLLLNDTKLLDAPMWKRKAYLKMTIREDVPNLFMKAEYVIKDSANDIEQAMENVFLKDWEGVMLKDPLSRYRIGDTCYSWLKIKPEYLVNYGEHLDLIVVGKIDQIKPAYICAVRVARKKPYCPDDPNESSYYENVELLTDEDCKFKTLAKIANGFNKELYEELNRKTEGKWRSFKQPPDEDLIKFGTNIPHFWIHPKDSVVLDVVARSVSKQQLNARFATDTTLYFAYTLGIRSDKDWRTVTTEQEYNESSNEAKLRAGERQEVRKRKQRRRTKRETETHDLNRNLGFITSTEESISDSQQNINPYLFKDFEIHIESDCRFNGKLVPFHQLRRLVESYGATVNGRVEDLRPDDDRQMIIVADIPVGDRVKSTRLLSFGKGTRKC